jgi:hypothetical protein
MSPSGGRWAVRPFAEHFDLSGAPRGSFFGFEPRADGVLNVRGTQRFSEWRRGCCHRYSPQGLGRDFDAAALSRRLIMGTGSSSARMRLCALPSVAGAAGLNSCVLYAAAPSASRTLAPDSLMNCIIVVDSRSLVHTCMSPGDSLTPIQ